jgi:hypothetical protein
MEAAMNEVIAKCDFMEAATDDAANVTPWTQFVHSMTCVFWTDWKS